jgi:RNA polymerase sigma factor (sigma-70 family)
MIDPLEFYSTINNIARRLTASRPYLFEDTRSEIITAILDSNSNDSPALALYKAKCCAIDVLRSRKYCHSFDGQVPHVSIEELDKFEEQVPYVESFENETVERIDVEFFMSLLSDKEKELVRLKFWMGLTQEQIGEIYGVVPSAVSHRIKHILERLRGKYEKDHNGRENRRGF